MRPLSENGNFVYVYEHPEDNGYTKIKVSKTKHNLVFKYDQRTLWKSLFRMHEYYDNDNQVIVQHLPTVFVKVLSVILFPVSLIINGVGNYNEVLRDIKRTIWTKKYGSFSSDYVRGVEYKLLVGKE